MWVGIETCEAYSIVREGIHLVKPMIRDEANYATLQPNSRTLGLSSRYLTKLICYTMIPSKSVQMTMLRGRQRSRACVKGTSDPMISSKGNSVTFIEHGIPNGVGYLNPRIIFLYSIWQKKKQLLIWADPSQAGRIKEKHEFRWTPTNATDPTVANIKCEANCRTGVPSGIQRRNHWLTGLTLYFTHWRLKDLHVEIDRL